MIDFAKKVFERFVECCLLVILFAVTIIAFEVVLIGLYRAAAYVGGF